MELFLFVGILVVMGVVGAAQERKALKTMCPQERIAFMDRKAAMAVITKKYDAIIFGGIASTGMLLLFACMVADKFFR